ncbi:MAG: 30S ribosomal protein S11 [Patescibacteria group bacterium]|nr:30S ribosomal protein S11 [Patescibacteria group bacterium]
MTDEQTKNVETTASATTDKKGAKGRKKTKTKAKGVIPHGKAYIQATYNNTIVTLTDLNGNVLSWASAGAAGFKGPKKSTPYAASIVVRNAVDKASGYGLKDVNILVSGVGQGREGAIRAFQANNVGVLSIKDITPIPHNGCRPPRPRRV